MCKNIALYGFYDFNVELYMGLNGFIADAVYLYTSIHYGVFKLTHTHTLQVGSGKVTNPWKGRAEDMEPTSCHPKMTTLRANFKHPPMILSLQLEMFLWSTAARHGFSSLYPSISFRVWMIREAVICLGISWWLNVIDVFLLLLSIVFFGGKLPQKWWMFSGSRKHPSSIFGCKPWVTVSCF